MGAGKSYWLVKSEPDAWSWDQMVASGAEGTGWTGVRNHLAKQQMMAMKLGDLAFSIIPMSARRSSALSRSSRPSIPTPRTPAANSAWSTCARSSR